jgi:hypothetical protein
VTGYDDPGGGPALRTLISFSALSRRLRSASRESVLAQLRTVFLAFLAAPFLFLYALQFMITDPAPPAGAALGGIAVLSAAMLGLEVWVRGRPLDVSSEAALANSYRTNFFLSVAPAEVPGWAGFAMALVTGTNGPYLIGMTAMLLGFLLAAPSRRDIARRQREIVAAGSSLSVGKALIRHPGR